MEYIVYVLRSYKDGQLYIGMTTDLKRRFSEHNKGYVRSTKMRMPLELLHYEVFMNRGDAEAREIYLKSGAGHQQLRAKLKHTLK